VEPWFIDEVRDRDGELLFKERPAVVCSKCVVDNTPRQQKSAHIVDGFDFSPIVPPSLEGAEGEALETSENVESEPAQTAPDEIIPAPRVIDARVAWQLTSMMRDVARRGTGAQSRSLGRDDIGGKTGTTNDFRDAWFSGFAGNLVTSVWVGRDDNQSLGYREYGSRSALPIWIDYMKVALNNAPEATYQMPPGMVQVRVDGEGHLLANMSADGITEYIKAEDLPHMQSEHTLQVDEHQPMSEEVFNIF